MKSVLIIIFAVFVSQIGWSQDQLPDSSEEISNEEVTFTTRVLSGIIRYADGSRALYKCNPHTATLRVPSKGRRVVILNNTSIINPDGTYSLYVTEENLTRIFNPDGTQQVIYHYQGSSSSRSEEGLHVASYKYARNGDKKIKTDILVHRNWYYILKEKNEEVAVTTEGEE